MTRINVVPPHCLSNQHLMAEYRELPRIFTAVLKAQKQGKTLDDFDVPDNYCLGKGHVTFFYPRGCWLRDRFRLLANELIHRKYNIDNDIYEAVLNSYAKIQNSWLIKHAWWEPSPEDMYLNMARLAKRSKMEKVMEELRRKD